MKKIIIYSALFCCCFVTSNIQAAERATPVFDDRSWVLKWSQNEDGGIFEEYVLEGETVTAWTELVSIQFFPGLQGKITPDVYEEKNKSALSKICSEIEWVSVSQSADERIWKWTIKGCQGQSDQSEIVRMKVTDEGYHVWHYASIKSPMPVGVEKIWLDNLKAIQISVEK